MTNSQKEEITNNFKIDFLPILISLGETNIKKIADFFFSEFDSLTQVKDSGSGKGKDFVVIKYPKLSSQVKDEGGEWKEEIAKTAGTMNELHIAHVEDGDDLYEGNFHSAAEQILRLEFLRIFDLLTAKQSATLIEKVEGLYGRYGTMTGSLGYQGLVAGVQSYQTGEDKMRDNFINLLRE